MPLRRHRPIVAHQLPELLAEDLLAVVEPQSACGEPRPCDLPHDRPQAHVHVERRRDGHRQLSLEALELGRPQRLVGLELERLREGGLLLTRIGAARDENHVQHGNGAREQDEDVELQLEPSRREQPREQERCRGRRRQDEPDAEQPLHAATRASGSSSARRPASASIASRFIESSIASRLNFARSYRLVSCRTDETLTPSRSSARSTYSRGVSDASRATRCAANVFSIRAKAAITARRGSRSARRSSSVSASTSSSAADSAASSSQSAPRRRLQTMATITPATSARMIDPTSRAGSHWNSAVGVGTSGRLATRDAPEVGFEPCCAES